MADDEEKVRANKDSESEGLPKDPGGIVAKGPTDEVRANRDSKGSDGDE